MWLIEKSPDKYTFIPINTTNVAYIDLTESEREKEKTISFAIKFCFIHTDNSKWIKWWFTDKEDRDKYYEKIRNKLPRIELGVDDITL
jgi:hypothetical protein